MKHAELHTLGMGKGCQLVDVATYLRDREQANCTIEGGDAGLHSVSP